MQELIPLSTLCPGQSAEIRQVVGQLDQVRRLEELGLRHGVQLEMVRHGTPCIIRIGGQSQHGSFGSSKLCFRQSDLLQVMVTPMDWV
jgi:ferrous iron transport protein A